MFKKVLEQAAKRKKPTNKRLLLQVLGLQAALLFFCLTAVVFFPERFHGIGPLLFVALGIGVVLWIEVFESESGVGLPDDKQG